MVAEQSGLVARSRDSWAWADSGSKPAAAPPRPHGADDQTNSINAQKAFPQRRAHPAIYVFKIDLCPHPTCAPKNNKSPSKPPGNYTRANKKVFGCVLVFCGCWLCCREV